MVDRSASGAGTLSGATSTSVTYSAPAGAPSGDVAVTITATSIANPAKSGIAQLTYVAIAVTVTPDSSTVEASSSTNVSGRHSMIPRIKGDLDGVGRRHTDECDEHIGDV
jgi:hypothetical protein